MDITNQLKNQHLLWRAGFGPMTEEYAQLSGASQNAYVKALFNASAKDPLYLDVADSAVKGLMMGIGDIANQEKRELPADQKKKLRQQSKEDLKNLNISWLDQMTNSEQQLREKMSLFWHGHFASRNINILYQQQLLDIIRRNALGNFGNLLSAVSKSAALINFLNNNQNRKGHPNENFAREVMELFTMGRDHYTENDVKEAARAFTGWGADLKGEFVFRKYQHDEGKKSIFGNTGNYDGDDVINMLLERKETAQHITRKIYKWFVNDQPDSERTEWLANRFYQGNYDISVLMKDIFLSEWFYEAKNIGNKIKSPVELIVGIRRALPMTIKNEEVQLVFQRLLGQLLFFPPNVAGWPGGKNWIDSSSLMLRLRIPKMLTEAGELTVHPKDDDDQMMGMADPKRTIGPGKLAGKLIETTINWNSYSKKFDLVPREKLFTELSNYVLQLPNAINEPVIRKYCDASAREQFIKTVTIQLMSTPEYQLC